MFGASEQGPELVDGLEERVEVVDCDGVLVGAVLDLAEFGAARSWGAGGVVDDFGRAGWTWRFG